MVSWAPNVRSEDTLMKYLMILLLAPTIAFSHSGGTNDTGGHRNHKDCSWFNVFDCYHVHNKKTYEHQNRDYSESKRSWKPDRTKEQEEAVKNFFDFEKKEAWEKSKREYYKRIRQQNK